MNLVSLRKLRFPEVIDYGADLSWREGFAGGVVACLLKFGPEWFTVSNPRHHVIDCCARTAVGKVHESELFLGVGRVHKGVEKLKN